eukprot:scaffold24072_cov67-Cyclotella_meneghiniana.AAC.2
MYHSSKSEFKEYEQELTPKVTASDIRIITFDLDNTLWKTGATISQANSVLNEHMQSFGVETLVEVEMGRLFEADKRLYAGGNFVEEDATIDNEKKDKDLASEVVNVGQTEDDSVIGKSASDLVHIRATSGKKRTHPVYLTNLRKDAIRSLLKGSLAFSDSVLLEEEVDKSFRMWMDARAHSITQNYAENVLSTLSKIQSSLVPPLDGKLYIGAITDGNSDPMSIPTIGDYFDFVIKAEDVGVSKPDGKVYKAAIGELMVTLMRNGQSVEKFFLGKDSDDSLGFGSVAYLKPSAKSWKDVDEETIEEFADAVGPWWVHVGDDFFKDVVASKGFRMRSIWVRELISKKQNTAREQEMQQLQKERRTVNDIENEITKQNGVLKMMIGESEFLASSLHKEFSDAILDRFDELSDLLIGWHEEGLKYQATTNSITSASFDPTVKTNVNNNTQEVTSGELGKSFDPTVKANVNNNTQEVTSGELGKTKFCLFCGEQLPPVAKFCSRCGEKQP